MVHYCNGCASLASSWCRRDAIDETHPWRWLTQKASKLLTRTQRRRHERTEELSIVSFLVFLLLQSRNGGSPDGLERLARFPQFVALRLDQVVCLLGVLVEGLLDLI